MKTTLIRCLFVFSILLMSVVTVQAADPCDPASVIAKANKLKSTKDNAKDMTALIELAKTIQAMNSACVTADPDIKKAEAGTGTRKNPVPLGSVFTVVKGEKNYFDIRITKITRGKAAVQAVMKANGFNDAPPEGHDYVLAFVELNYTKGDETEPLTLSKYDFTGYSNGQFVETSSVVLPKPSLDVKAFPGAKASGWIMIDAFTEDTQPVIFLGSTYSGEGLYFATW